MVVVWWAVPVCKIDRKAHPSGLAPQPVEKRQLGAHWDSSGYLEIIVTIGIFGTVDVQLVHPPTGQRSSDILPRPRTEGIEIKPGHAYALWAKSRWKSGRPAIERRTTRAATAGAI